MSKKPREKPAKSTDLAPDPQALARLARRAHLRRELGGIALLLTAVFIAGSLLAGGSASGASCSSAGGIFGPVGACLRSGVLISIGDRKSVV